MNWLFEWLRRQDGAMTSSRVEAVCFCTDTREGIIRMWKEGICEMSVFDGLKNERIFWSHFDDKDATEFFRELQAFFAMLYSSGQPADAAERPVHADADMQNTVYTVLLVCSSGLSSGLLAEKLQRLADQKGLAVRVRNADMTSWANVSADVVLFAPQARSVWLKMDEKDKGRAVLLSPLEYGSMDTEAILEHARKRFKESRDSNE